MCGLTSQDLFVLHLIGNTSMGAGRCHSFTGTENLTNWEVGGFKRCSFPTSVRLAAQIRRSPVCPARWDGSRPGDPA